VAKCADIELKQTGCLFLAREAEELQVLDEFVQGRHAMCRSSIDNPSTEKLLNQSDLAQFNGLRTKGLLGGVWSADAWKVDQRAAAAKLTHWLQHEHGVSFQFGAEAKAISATGSEVELGVVEPGVVEVIATSADAAESVYKCDHAIICSGDEFSTLYPEAFLQSGVSRCELQMLRTAPQPAPWKLKPFILGGLSLTRYSAFESCASLADLRRLQKTHYSDYLDHGIHVLACQESDGSITIGDSHKYGSSFAQARSDQIDELMLANLSDMIELSDARIEQRWKGHYAYLSGSEFLRLSPAPRVTAVTATNGQGMTHAFAVAERVIDEIAG